MRVLAEHWSAKPPQRRDRRSPAAAEVLLVHGLVQARRMVGASELARSGKPVLRGAKDDMKASKQFNKLRFGSMNPDKTTTGTLLTKDLVAAAPKQVLEKLETAGDKQLMQRSSVA